MDLGTLLNNLRQDGSITTVMKNPLAQFGSGNRRYLGAELLPERPVLQNEYKEENIRYRTVIANDGGRYSPVQRKKGDLIGSMEVALGDSDIGREFSGRDYDMLMRILNMNASMDAALQMLNWLDTVINRALVELNEKQRWQALVNASVVRSGHNGYSETVSYPNPSGHRVNAGGTWSNNSYDPYSDILAIVALLEGKGYKVSRIITRRSVLSILQLNAKMRERGGITTINVSNQLAAAPGRLDLSTINAILGKDGLPPIELYDLQYRTQTGTSYFLPAGTMVFVCTTGRDENLDLGDSVKQVTDTLGYHAIGLPTGYSEPGRVAELFPKRDRPPRIDSQGWQASIPVITEAEAVAVISSIS